jgi:hypothetical protein
MAKFMDVHTGMKGISQADLQKEHEKDLVAEKSEKGVHFHKAWADPATGTVFCLSEGPNKEAVRRVHEKAGHPAGEIYEVPFAVE